MKRGDRIVKKANCQRTKHPKGQFFCPKRLHHVSWPKGSFLSMTRHVIYTLHKYSHESFDLIFLPVLRLLTELWWYFPLRPVPAVFRYGAAVWIKEWTELARGTMDGRDGISIMPKSLEAKTGLLFRAEGEEPFSTITNLCIVLFIFSPSKSA